MKYFFLIFLFFVSACSSKEIYVYEKIPETMECYSFKEYFEIDNCNRKNQINLSKEVIKVIETDNYIKIRKLN